MKRPSSGAVSCSITGSSAGGCGAGDGGVVANGALVVIDAVVPVGVLVAGLMTEDVAGAVAAGSDSHGGTAAACCGAADDVEGEGASGAEVSLRLTCA
ncbi:hypothetical protein I5746_06195 [Burkholderia gladioli]|nr:hypothetical protein [Burkholderia gladioli]